MAQCIMVIFNLLTRKIRPLWIAVTFICLGCFAIVFVISILSDYSTELQPKATSGGVWALVMCGLLAISVIYTTCRVVATLNGDTPFSRLDFLSIGAPNLAFLVLVQGTFYCMRNAIEYNFFLSFIIITITIINRQFFVNIFKDEDDQSQQQLPNLRPKSNVEMLTLTKPTFFVYYATHFS